MRTSRISARLFFSGFFAITLVTLGCSRDDSSNAIDKAGVTSPASSSVLATVGGEKVTLADVENRAGDDLKRIDTQYKLIRSQLIEAALDSVIRERTLGDEAKRQGKTIEELVRAEAGPGLNPGDSEIAMWYNSNLDRVRGRPLADVAPQIADLLRREKLEISAKRLESRLMKEKAVKVYFEPYRFELANSDAPSLGNANAPVTLVEFSDFQCPFCQRFSTTLHDIARAYGDSVRIVYRQFPIESIHPFALRAAEASLCANEQGKFWELHDAMFQDQSRLAVPDLVAKASRLGLDTQRFQSCIDSRKYAQQVQKDLSEGARLGVTGTPALFVNGLELRGGAVPLPVVRAAIDKEFERIRRRQ
ncbi:MAG TPA: thioredoxin domain-containing protein [Gemmatimonadaceae bacterium]